MSPKKLAQSQQLAYYSRRIEFSEENHKFEPYKLWLRGLICKTNRHADLNLK